MEGESCDPRPGGSVNPCPFIAGNALLELQRPPTAGSTPIREAPHDEHTHGLQHVDVENRYQPGRWPPESVRKHSITGVSTTVILVSGVTGLGPGATPALPRVAAFRRSLTGHRQRGSVSDENQQSSRVAGIRRQDVGTCRWRPWSCRIGRCWRPIRRIFE